MPSDLEALLPPYLRNICEISMLMGVEGETLDQAEDAMNRVKDNLYVQTCDAATLEQYERMLGLATVPDTPILDRRRAVLSGMNRRLPYTAPRLKEDLNAALGADGYELYIRPERYELELDVIDRDYQASMNVKATVREMIPAHLLFIFAGKYPSQIPIEVSIGVRLGLTAEFYARYNRLFLYLDGTWPLDGAYPLNGCKEALGLELYPAAFTVSGSWHTDCAAGSAVEYEAEAPVNVGRAAAMGIVGGAEAKPGAEVTISVESSTCAAPGLGYRMKVEIDLWYLDGTQALNGEKMLDAEIFDYEL